MKSCWLLLLLVGMVLYLYNLQLGKRGSHIQVCGDSRPNENRFLREESDALFHYLMAVLQHFLPSLKHFWHKTYLPEIFSP